MAKVTNEVLAEKIDNLNRSFSNYKIDHKQDHGKIEIEQKLNTEFRQKAYGVLGFMTVVFGAITAFGMWVINKLWR